MPVDVSQVLRDVSHCRLEPLVNLLGFDFVVLVHDPVPQTRAGGNLLREGRR